MDKGVKEGQRDVVGFGVGGWVHTEKNIGGAIIMNSVIHIPE